MVEWIKGLFSSAPGLSRVNPVGLIVMALALLLTLFSGKIARKFEGEEKGKVFLILKLSSLVICIAGFVIAIA